MNASPEDPRDPRYRPYRGLTNGFYLVFTITFSSLIVFSVYLSVLRMTPGRPPVGKVRPEADCLNDASALFTALEAQRKLQGDEKDVAHSDQRFLQFRVEWLQRKRTLESSCGLESRERLKDVFDTLDRVVDLYTTNSTQFSGAVGPTVDEFKKRVGP